MRSASYQTRLYVSVHPPIVAWYQLGEDVSAATKIV
jgi:hypothetical protein